MTVSEDPEPGMVTVADLDDDTVAALPNSVFAEALRRVLAEQRTGRPGPGFVMHDRVML